MDADRLTIEITESSLLRNEQTALASMHKLRDLGAHLSIDDFGTGYSSLSRLSEFPIELLKIPKPFVTRLVGEEGDELFVDAILRLAESLNLVTVSEGVEQVPQLQRLHPARLRARAGLPVQPAARGVGRARAARRAGPLQRARRARARRGAREPSARRRVDRHGRRGAARRSPASADLTARRSRGEPAPRAGPRASSACCSRSAGCARA